MSAFKLLVVAVLLLAVVSIDAAPFFDAIYDAINGYGRRSYGYGGYSGYGDGYYPRNVHRPRQEKSFKDICKVHYPDSFGAPGAAGVVCPY